MERFLYISLALLAAVQCSFAGMLCNIKDYPTLKLVQDKICNNISRPTPAQMNAFMECNKPCNSTENSTLPDQNEQMKMLEKMIDVIKTNCTVGADDVNNLKTPDITDEQFEKILGLCSKKFEDCLKLRWTEYGENAKSEGHTKTELTSDQKKAWEDKITEKINCMTKAVVN